MSEAKNDVQQFCSQVWWLVLLRGIAVFILGVLFITRPAMTVIILVQFLGFYFLIDGMFAIVNSVMGRKYMQGWGWGLLMGALEILTGIFIVANPLFSTLITTVTLAYCVAFMAILFGVIGIITGFQVRKQVKGEWAMIASGVLAIIFGLILIKNPKGSVAAYLMVMGVMAMIGGIIQIFASFQIRQIGKKGLDASME